MAATLEYLVEVYFFPKLKLQISAFPTMTGLLLVLIGQTTRTLAMVHAGTNFNHLVQRQRRPGHVLVTKGIYAWLRHPSYFGYYWWGLGTQLLLANPLCFITYAIVLWKFFNERIRSKPHPTPPFSPGQPAGYPRVADAYGLQSKKDFLSAFSEMRILPIDLPPQRGFRLFGRRYLICSQLPSLACFVVLHISTGKKWEFGVDT